jgi:hypothetical protein
MNADWPHGCEASADPLQAINLPKAFPACDHNLRIPINLSSSSINSIQSCDRCPKAHVHTPFTQHRKARIRLVHLGQKVNQRHNNTGQYNFEQEQSNVEAFIENGCEQLQSPV